MPENSFLQMCWRSGLKRPQSHVPVGSLFSSSSQLVLLPQTKESIAPRTLHDHSKAFVCLQWPLKSLSQIPHSCFLPLLKKKKNTRKLFWCKKERPAGTRINGDKETWRLTLFSTLWPLSISGYGQTLWSLCGEDGEPNKRGHSLASDLFSYEARLDFWRKATSCPRRPIPRVFWSCCFVTAQRLRQCCGLGILVWSSFKGAVQNNRKEHPLGLRGWAVTPIQVSGVCSGLLFENVLRVGAERWVQLTPFWGGGGFPKACCVLFLPS